MRVFAIDALLFDFFFRSEIFLNFLVDFIQVNVLDKRLFLLVLAK